MRRLVESEQVAVCSEGQVPERGPSGGKERLLALAAFLEALNPSQFNFGAWVTKSKNGCGTVCCAIGWCPVVFPDHFRWGSEEEVLVKTPGGNWTGVGSADRFFEITKSEFRHLFVPMCQTSGRGLSGKARPKTIAAHIQKFVNRKWPEPAATPAPSQELPNSEPKASGIENRTKPNEPSENSGGTEGEGGEG